ncbi:AraC family transcriptional regulator, partial [Clostridium perfringens]
MNEFNSCEAAIKSALENKYFSIAHLYKEEKSMAMHIHDSYEIYYSITGGKQFLIGNKFYDIKPGDLFVINQFESHYISKLDK